MENFEELALQYQPMIHKIIRSLNIYKNLEEYFRTALIALWDAHKGFDSRKGNFTSYAYSYIKGRLLSEMSSKNQLSYRNVYPDEEYWETIEDQVTQVPFENERIHYYCMYLNEKESRWLVATFIEGLPIREFAEREKVSVSAVKKWRGSALNKLRAIV